MKIVAVAIESAPAHLRPNAVQMQLPAQHSRGGLATQMQLYHNRLETLNNSGCWENTKQLKPLGALLARSRAARGTQRAHLLRCYSGCAWQ